MLCDNCKKDGDCNLQRSAAGKNISGCAKYEPNVEPRNTEGNDKEVNDIINFEMEKIDNEERWMGERYFNPNGCDIDTSIFEDAQFEGVKIFPEKVENYNNIAATVKTLAKSCRWVLGCDFYPPKDDEPDAYVCMNISELSLIQETASRLISRLFALSDTTSIVCIEPDENGERKIRLSFSVLVWEGRKTLGRRTIKDSEGDNTVNFKKNVVSKKWNVKYTDKAGNEITSVIYAESESAAKLQAEADEFTILEMAPSDDTEK